MNMNILLGGAAVWEWALVFALPVAVAVAEIMAGRRASRSMMARSTAVTRWVVSLIVAAAFGLFVWHRHGLQAGQEYFSGFLVEYGLSVDNIAVWVQIFVLFSLSKRQLRQPLILGVLLSLLLRTAFVFMGVGAIQRFAVATVVMGVVLLYTAKKLAASDDEIRNQEAQITRFITKVLPYAPNYRGLRLVVWSDGRFKLTPVGAGAIVVGIADVVFAIDSIPAILSITQNQFVVVSSNMMALMGLMSLYYVFESIKDRLPYLQYGLAVVMMLVSVKLLISAELFWDLLWNGYDMSIGTGLFLVLGVPAIFAARALQRYRKQLEPFSIQLILGCVSLVLLVVNGVLAPWTAFKRSLWQAHAVEVPVVWGLASIVLVLAVTWAIGRIAPPKKVA